MGSELAFHLVRGDQAWEHGALATARESYFEALRVAPRSWHAVFMTAWIDLAFAPLDDELMREVVRAAPSASWRDRLAARADDAARGVALAGGLALWDIDTMRRTARPSGSWWESCAHRANVVGQFGLARACFDEALNYTSIYEYDPPREYNQVVLAARSLLDALAA
jgi:hypothetical protein